MLSWSSILNEILERIRVLVMWMVCRQDSTFLVIEESFFILQAGLNLYKQLPQQTYRYLMACRVYVEFV